MNLIKTYTDSHGLPGTPDGSYLATACDGIGRFSAGIPGRSFQWNRPFACIATVDRGDASISGVQQRGSSGIIFMLQSHAKYRATTGNQSVSVQR
jgi:hypothetical protein